MADRVDNNAATLQKQKPFGGNVTLEFVPGRHHLFRVKAARVFLLGAARRLPLAEELGDAIAHDCNSGGLPAGG